MPGASWNSQGKELRGVQIFYFSTSNLGGSLVLRKDDTGCNVIPSFWIRICFMSFPLGTEHFSWKTKIKTNELLLCRAGPCHSNPTLLFGSTNFSSGPCGISDHPQFLEFLSTISAAPNLFSLFQSSYGA